MLSHCFQCFYYLLRHPAVMGWAARSGLGGGGGGAGRRPSFTGILLEEIALQSARQPPPHLICTLWTDPEEQQPPKNAHVNTNTHSLSASLFLLFFFPPFFLADFSG